MLLPGAGYGLHSIAVAFGTLCGRPLRWLLGWRPAAPARPGGAAGDAPVRWLRGPGTRDAADNQCSQLRARDANNHPHHIVIRDGGTAARSERPALNTGMTVTPNQAECNCGGFELRAWARRPGLLRRL